MKRELLCGAAVTFITVGLTAFNAFAENYTVQGTVIEANPVYQTVTKQVPTQTCQMVQVPVYGNGSQGNGGTLGLNNNFDIVVLLLVEYLAITLLRMLTMAEQSAHCWAE